VEAWVGAGVGSNTCIQWSFLCFSKGWQAAKEKLHNHHYQMMSRRAHTPAIAFHFHVVFLCIVHCVVIAQSR